MAFNHGQDGVSIKHFLQQASIYLTFKINMKGTGISKQHSNMNNQMFELKAIPVSWISYASHINYNWWKIYMGITDRCLPSTLLLNQTWKMNGFLGMDYHTFTCGWNDDQCSPQTNTANIIMHFKEEPWWSSNDNQYNSEADNQYYQG